MIVSIEGGMLSASLSEKAGKTDSNKIKNWMIVFIRYVFANVFKDLMKKFVLAWMMNLSVYKYFTMGYWCKMAESDNSIVFGDCKVVLNNVWIGWRKIRQNICSGDGGGRNIAKLQYCNITNTR